MIRHRRDLGKIVTVAGNSAEIGVAEGFFSADILSWENNFPRHYMVDRWACVPTQKGDSSNSPDWHARNYDAALQRVAKYGDRAQILRGNSQAMSLYVDSQSLALLYIDGDHSYEGVLGDLCAWVPKVKLGGIVALHDYENPVYGVKRAVGVFCDKYGFKIHLLPEDKMEDAGAYFVVDSIQNILPC